MTTTPMEPAPDPDIVPSGDPSVNPVSPDVEPDGPIPETDPERV